MSKVQNTSFNDKDNLRYDYMAQDIIVTRLDVMEKKVPEPVDQLQL